VSAAPTRRFARNVVLLVAAAVLLTVTVVLPAERGVDPTGVGSLLGLTEMGTIKVELAREAEADSIAEAAPRASFDRADAGTMFDSTDVILAPGGTHEIKLVMAKDARVEYRWSVDRGVVNYDTHADSPTIKYHGYAKGTGVKADSGRLIAAFDGQHGWFWRNRGRDTVVVTLRVQGHFSELKRLP
jgi:hypothetical protein